MNTKLQYDIGERISGKWADNSRFYNEPADEVAFEIARKLHGLWDWQEAVERVYAPGGLEQLANEWLRKNKVVADAGHARVKELPSAGGESKYVAEWKRRLPAA